MTVLKKVLYVVTGISLLTGCSNHPELAYRKSQNGNKLVVKRPLTRRFIENTFVLPHVGKYAPKTTEPPKS